MRDTQTDDTVITKFLFHFQTTSIVIKRNRSIAS